MRGSSVHFKPIHSAIHAVTHASRDVPPTYLLPKDMSLGTLVVIDDAGEVSKLLAHKSSLASRQAKVSKEYSPMWEGVMNLRRPESGENPDDYKKECGEVVKEWCKKYEAMTGHKVIRADVHLDEGHIVDGEILLNAHAHMMCDKTNEKGRVLKLSPQKLRELQTITASVTNLERGVNSRISGKKHIGAHQYKYLAERGRLENQKHLDVEKTKAKTEIHRVRTLASQWSKEDAEKLKEDKAVADKVPQLEATISTQATEIARLNEQYRLDREAMKASGTAKQADYQELKKALELATAQVVELTKKVETMTQENKALTEANAKLEADKARFAAMANNYQAEKAAGVPAHLIVPSPAPAPVAQKPPIGFGANLAARFPAAIKTPVEAPKPQSHPIPSPTPEKPVEPVFPRLTEAEFNDLDSKSSPFKKNDRRQVAAGRDVLVGGMDVSDAASVHQLFIGAVKRFIEKLLGNYVAPPLPSIQKDPPQAVPPVPEKKAPGRGGVGR